MGFDDFDEAEIRMRRHRRTERRQLVARFTASHGFERGMERLRELSGSGDNADVYDRHVRLVQTRARSRTGPRDGEILPPLEDRNAVGDGIRFVFSRIMIDGVAWDHARPASPKGPVTIDGTAVEVSPRLPSPPRGLEKN